MPRFNGVLTIPFWLDAENEGEVESLLDAIVGVAGIHTNVIAEKVTSELTEEPRPTNAELSSTV